MSFERPLLLLTLLVLAAAVALVWWLQRRRRMRYAVRFTNIDVLAAVAGGRAWRSIVPLVLFVAALAALALASARPHVERLVPKDKAMVILVIDTSRSMQAKDVKPTRLAAAQEAMRTFLDRAPEKIRVGLVVFAGDAQVATPPTHDHDLVRQAVDEVGEFQSWGGTAIGDALATAVQLAQESLAGPEQTIAFQAAPAEETKSLASILFLSDGAQTRGILQPSEGAQQAKDAGIPVYTVALGTPEGTVTGPLGFGFGGPAPGGGGGGGQRIIPVPPDPFTMREVAETTGGEFTEARSADSLAKTYEKLGSQLGHEPGETEVTFLFLAGAGALLLAAGVLSALWSPRFP